jgi:hypothetical protein
MTWWNNGFDHLIQPNVLHEDDRETDVCIAQINIFFCFIHQINTLPLKSDKYYEKTFIKLQKNLLQPCFENFVSNKN